MEPLYTCRCCNRSLPNTAFVPDKRRKIGIDLRCKECFNEQRRTARNKARIPPVMEGTKYCTGCATEKPVTAFATNPNMSDGRNNWCKTCIKGHHDKRYAEEPDYFRAISRKKNRKLRWEVLTHYSSNPPKCACCGEPHIEFLAIDHINGNGNQHRKTIPRGSYIYQWLRNNKYPPGFQVLCHNCNMAKGFYGYCPHQKQE